jgi:uncharacterized protein YndB with AHSA1/START domain
MGFLVRALRILLVLVLLCAVVLWFAARRGDRGYIELEVTIDRPAPVVFRWITSDELLRRWISDLVKLEKTGPSGAAQPNNVYRIDEFILKRRVVFDARVIRTIPNQEIEWAVKPADESSGGYIATADFKLFPNGDYTRIVFTSQANFLSLGDQMIEPILTYSTRKKLQDDLARLKLRMEAESAINRTSGVGRQDRGTSGERRVLTTSVR